MNKEETWQMVLKIRDVIEKFEAKHYTSHTIADVKFAICTECARQKDDSMINFIMYFGHNYINTVRAVCEAYDYDEFMNMVNG